MRFTMVATDTAPGAIRHELSRLGGRAVEPAIEDLKIVLSELLGISVLHGARRPIEVELRLGPEAVEATIRDEGAAARAVAAAESDEAARLGLQIVESLGASVRAEGDELSFYLPVKGDAAATRAPAPPPSGRAPAG